MHDHGKKNNKAMAFMYGDIPKKDKNGDKGGPKGNPNWKKQRQTPMRALCKVGKAHHAHP